MHSRRFCLVMHTDLFVRNYILIIIILGFSCSSKKRVENVQDDGILFLREVLSDTTNFKHNYAFSDIDINSYPLLIISGDTAFTKYMDYLAYLLDESDTVFLRNQLVNVRNFTLNTLASDTFKIIPFNGFKEHKISTDSMWNYLHKANIEKYCSVSMPIFNRKNDRAYFRFGCYCGNLCGGGYEVLMIRTNGKWRVKDRIGAWVS